MIVVDKLIDGIVGLWLLVKGTEPALHRHQGYRKNSCVLWRRKGNISWHLFWKILSKIEIYNAQQVREIILSIVRNNSDIFDNNCYVASFGKIGKSGTVMMYEFNHCVNTRNDMLIRVSDLPSLPPKSKIVFVEDLIGTGTQSLEYITDELNLWLNQSHIPYLLTLCATPEAIQKVQDNSNFTVLNGLELTEEHYQHYSEASCYFTENEKKELLALNKQLKDPEKFDYDRGLLLAFYYATPNNSMPIIWKDKFSYKDSNNIENEWYALLPRYF